MADYTISYVVTTYNKLPYLQQVLARLVAARQPNEEIVVCDGGSKDGTPDYLRGLYEAGQIQQFVSERDKGEAHGFNKGMLLAQGEVIKIITDDDAFDYAAIRQAAGFLLEHPDVDIISGNTGLIHLEHPDQATLYDDVADNFQRWLHHKEVVWMIGLPLIIRRKSLALTGLFHTGAVQVDTEFTYRITSLNVNLAWSTAVLSTRIENPQSNFRVMNQGKAANASTREANRMRFYYDKTIGDSFRDYVRHKSGWLEALKKPIRPAKRLVYDLLRRPQYQGNRPLPTGFSGVVPSEPAARIATAFEVCDRFMADYNARHPVQFFHKSEQLTKALS